MKGFLVFFLTVILICSCSSLPKETIFSKLPPLKYCQENPNVESSEAILNELVNLKDLSFSHAYNIISVRSDSLEREIIRHTNAKIARTIVKEWLSNVEILPDSLLKVRNYSYVMTNTSNIYSLLPQSEQSTSKRPGMHQMFPKKPHIVKLEKSIGELIIPSNREKQLFIEIRTYSSKNQFNNSLNFYVFNTKNNSLLYKDKISYSCDIRDKAAFIKVLNFGLNKLKESVR
ncbi:hypothetical protein [Maribacter sp. HTCC2170]|uniref:hypothetical protein n=1 Tax=Maribacter sp. (strain HTCC2170 / KCCM 42371) TaxID=313603 RepID=UPI00006B4770|nr:hypothetical protein [Maribacter sp. HTCC2170]EAR01922.1 hypothetical protein FB2170_15378 [Maribacter sp. HTCC2170]